MDNVGGLWAIGVVPCCLVPEPGVIEGRENVGLVLFESLIKGMVGV